MWQLKCMLDHRRRMNRSNDDYRYDYGDFRYDDDVRREHGNYSANRNRPMNTPRISRSDMAAYDASNYLGRSSRHSRNHKRRNIMIAIAAAIVLVLVIPGIALAVSAKGAMDDAKVMMAQGQQLASQLKTGDMAGAQTSANEFAATAKKLDDNVSSLLWAPATLIPVYGEDVKEVRVLAKTANELSAQVLVPVVDALPTGGMSQIFSDGGFNPEAIQAICGPLEESAVTINECTQQIEGLGDPHLEQLKRPVELAKSLMPTVNEVAQSAYVLPNMLGMNGPRTYLLIACTEAETRSVGGFPGSAGIMTLDNGKISIGDMSAPELPITDEPGMMQANEEEQLIFGNRVAQYFYDAGYIPHFPRAAEFMKQMWEMHGKPAIDGIVSVDPVFLQNVLALTGPITTSDGTVVDGANAAEMLMNTVYIELTNDEQSADGNALTADQKQSIFFSDVASQALGGIFNNLGSIDVMDFFNMLMNSIDTKRFYAWMVDADEQAVLEKLDAACAVSDSETAPETGVYIGAAMGTKIGWYLDADVQVSDGRKNLDGTTSYDVTVTITNMLPEEVAATLPAVVTGNGYVPIKRTASDMLLDVYLYAPAGGTITDMQTSGYFVPSTEYAGGWYTRPTDEPMTRTSYNGREVYYGVTAINGQETTTITYTVTTSSKAEEKLAVDMTPLARDK